MANQPVSVVGGSALGHGAVSVGLTPVPIPVTQMQQTVSVFNLGTVTIYLGNAAVTTATGYPVPINSERLVAVNGPLYAISGTAAQDVRWLAEVLGT